MLRFSEILKNKIFSSAYSRRFKPHSSEKKAFFDFLDDTDLKEKFQSKFSDYTYISNDFNPDSTKQNFFQYYDDQHFQHILKSKITTPDYLENLPPNNIKDKNLFFRYFDKKQILKLFIPDVVASVLLLFYYLTYLMLNHTLHNHSNHTVSAQSDNKPQKITAQIYPQNHTLKNSKLKSNHAAASSISSSMKTNKKIHLQNQYPISFSAKQKSTPTTNQNTSVIRFNTISNPPAQQKNIPNNPINSNTYYINNDLYLTLRPLMVQNNLSTNNNFNILINDEATPSLPEQKNHIHTPPNYFLQLTSNFNYIHNTTTLSPQISFLISKKISHTPLSIFGGIGYTYIPLPDYYMTVGRFANYDFGFHQKNIVMNYRYLNYISVPINLSFHYKRSNIQAGIYYMYMFNASGKLYIQEMHQQQFTTFSSKEYSIKNISDGINTQPISFNFSYMHQISKNIYAIAEYQRFISALNNTTYKSNFNLKNIQSFKIGLQIKIH